MFIKLNQQPDHGFDEPLGLLSDCHRRIERFLGIMLLVARQDDGAALPAESRRAVEQALHYFRTAGPRHTADEEESLFPRLEAADHPEADEARTVMRRLDSDHRAAEEHHARVDELVSLWLARDVLAPEAVAELRSHLAALEEMYRDHIATEDRRLFPAAARILDRETIAKVGREMARRRGLEVRQGRDEGAD